MKLRYEKNVRLMGYLLGYCHMVGANEFDTHLAMEAARSVIEVRCKVKNLPQARLDELTQCMNIPRRYEVEQSFWDISGEEELDSELSLAGMMTDQSDIAYDGEELRICCVRLYKGNAQ